MADVSVAFGDWVYTDAYARCVAKSDTAAIETMKRQYFQEVDTGIAQMKENSRRVFGRAMSRWPRRSAIRRMHKSAAAA